MKGRVEGQGGAAGLVASLDLLVGDATLWLLQVVALLGFHFRHCWKQLKNRVQAAGCVSVCSVVCHLHTRTLAADR